MKRLLFSFALILSLQATAQTSIPKDGKDLHAAKQDTVKKTFILTEQEGQALFQILDFARKTLPTSTAPANSVTQICAVAEAFQKLLAEQYQKQSAQPGKKP